MEVDLRRVGHVSVLKKEVDQFGGLGRVHVVVRSDSSVAKGDVLAGVSLLYCEVEVHGCIFGKVTQVDFILPDNNSIFLLRDSDSGSFLT